ncbi:hypothetical protein EJB05_29188, partial [Eragrostis curvula]
MVISVVAQEAVSRIISCLFQDEGKVESNANENLERLEMAHIRLGAVLETSERWQVFDPSLLRWRRKLKHAAQECDDMLHKCKRRSLEDEQKKLELRNSSLPNWIATATKSFVSSIFNCDNNELSESIVRRFECKSSLKILRENLLNSLLKTCHGCHLWINSRKNIGTIFTTLGLNGVSDVSIEPVIEVNFQCQVSLSVQKKQLMTSLPEDKISTQASPHLKAGISFHPHGSSGAMLPVTKSSAITSIVDKEQDCMHTDITLEQLKDIILPRAIDYFRENSDATLYQMIWKSKHGCAFIQFEKASISSTRRTSMQTRGSNGGARKRKVLLGEYEELRRRTRMIAHLIQLWGAHAPPRVRRMLAAWVEKEKEIQLEAPQLQLKF